MAVAVGDLPYPYLSGDDVIAAIRKGYRIHKVIGGGEGYQGTFGGLNQNSLCQSVRLFAQLTGVNSNSVVFDFGTGTCLVLLGFSAICRVRTLTGVEFDQSKVDRGQTVLIGVSAWATARNKALYLPAWDVMTTAVDISQLAALPEGTTHAWAFWAGIAEPEQDHYLELCRLCPTLRGLAFVDSGLTAARLEGDVLAAFKVRQPRLAHKGPVVAMGRHGFTLHIFTLEPIG